MERMIRIRTLLSSYEPTQVWVTRGRQARVIIGSIAREPKSAAPLEVFANDGNHDKALNENADGNQTNEAGDPQDLRHRVDGSEQQHNA